MLHAAPVIEAVCDELAARARGIPLVADPVMVAKGGHPLLAPDAVETLKARLLPLATVITPNLPEAEVLTGRPIRDLADMREAAAALRALGVPAVLLKGGHLEGDAVTDLLVTADAAEEFVSPRIATRHTHGTGCTLASAVAAGLAQGMSLRDSVMRARAYVRAAIAAAPGYGAGHGPLDHAVTFDPGRVPG
jgi:hydroxymethylpyrimidine/phosphomethylpyrimidine kinase